jgi:hypothetical protein
VDQKDNAPKDPQDDDLVNDDLVVGGDDELVIGDETVADPFTAGGSMSQLTDISGKRLSVDDLASLADSLVLSSPQSPTPGGSSAALEATASSGISLAAEDLAGNLGSGMKLFPDATFASASSPSLGSSSISPSAIGSSSSTSMSGVLASDAAGVAESEGLEGLEGLGSVKSLDTEEGLGSEKGIDQESVVEPESEKSAEKKKKPAKSKGKFGEKILAYQKYLEWSGLAVIAIVLAVLGYMSILLISTAVFLIAMVGVAYGIWLSRKTNTVYSIMLGCALMAVIAAAYCMWVEFERYHYDFKGKDAKLRVGMVVPGQFGPARTIAAACPNVVRLTSNADAGAEINGSSWTT